VSQHLRVLREHGFATVRADGARRLYAVDPTPLQEVDVWLDRYRRFWHQRLDALGTELKRGQRQPGGPGRTPEVGRPRTPGAEPSRTPGDSAGSARRNTTTKKGSRS
jgi:hypothetical protein